MNKNTNKTKNIIDKNSKNDLLDILGFISLITIPLTLLTKLMGTMFFTVQPNQKQVEEKRIGLFWLTL